MSSRIRPLLCFCVLLALGVTAFAADLFSQRYDLRAYGAVTAQEMPAIAKYGTYRHLRLMTQDHEKGVILCSKMLRDFTTLPTAQLTTVTSGATTLDAVRLSNGQALLPVLLPGARQVDVYSFANAAALQIFLQRAGNEVAGAESCGERRYPFYMDFWDRHAMGFWYRLQQNANGQTDASDMVFMKKYGLNINMANAYEATAARARREGLGYKINRWFTVFNWAYEKYPEAANSSDPDMTVMPDYYGEVPYAENPIERNQVADVMTFYKQFIDDEYLISITAPHGEIGPHQDNYTGQCDRNEYSRRDFVYYLRDIRKLSLDDLSRRWYGAPGKFASWDEVKFPREREFYGWQDGASQDLAGTWKTRILDRATGEKEAVFATKYDDTRWLTFQQPGAQFLSSLDRRGLKRGGWMRTSFQADASLLSERGPIYLTICTFSFAPYTDPSVVYLNGTKVAELTVGYGHEWGQIDVRPQLQRGTNVLAVYTCSGNVGGPTFLTRRKVESFPTTDPLVNARLYDVREWVADSCARANKRYVEYMRGIDPNRPIKMMAFDSMIDIMLPYAQELGVYPHCTGEGAFFRPWFKRFGYLRGIPDSSEPGGPARDLEQFKRYFFTMTFEGMNAHDYFWDLRDMLNQPAQTAYYEKNVNYFELMGRFDLKKPDIAIARSVKVDRILGGDSKNSNDPSRGDIQQAHFGYLFADERDLRDGLLKEYKVIIDDNFHTLAPEDIDILERYVRDGGTLVLNQRSGRNTYLHPNSWPINRLTGCTPTIRPEEGTLIFEANPPILKAYARKTFANTGEAVDWQKRDYFTDSIALKPLSNDVQVIARYQDGQPAITLRPLGKGKVLVLGSAFYRNSHDDGHGFFLGSPEQTLFYKALFSDLGVQPLMQSAQDFLWAERFIANNGTTEMLILGNRHFTDMLQDASATWTLDFTPRRVFDPVTGQDLPVKITGHTVTIDHLNLEPYEMRYYAVERPVDGIGLMQHWLFRQGQLWKAAPAGRETPQIDPSWPITLQGNFAVKQFEKEADARQALDVHLVTDATWQSLPPSNWETAGLRMDQNLFAVYRKTFTIDPAWLQNLRGVEVYWEARPYITSPSEIYLNGLMVNKNNKPVNQEKILGVLKPGENLFTYLMKARADGDGGFLNNFTLRGIPGANGEQMDISKGWTINVSDTDTYLTDFPAKATFILARKSLLIPAKYRNYSVWIEVKASELNSMTAVSTNNRLRYIGPRHGSAYWQGAFLMNITPDVKFGEENDLIIGSGKYLKEGIVPSTCTIEYARLIFVPKE